MEEQLQQCLDNLHHSFVIADPSFSDRRIIAVSSGFRQQTGYSKSDLLGSDLDLLLQNLPVSMVSKSSRVKLNAYFADCCNPEAVLPELAVVLPCSCKDGSVFARMLVATVCRVGPANRCFVLCVQLPVDDGCLTKHAQSECQEHARILLKQAKKAIFETYPSCRHNSQVPSTHRPSFYSERLQESALLKNGCHTVVRREASQVARGCIVFGQEAVRPTPEGLRFGVHVDSVTTLFKGLPMLGFTKRKPCDVQGLYPPVSKCLGGSFVVGGVGEAYVRDKLEHFDIGFGQPPAKEIESWFFQPCVPLHKKSAPVCISSGDILEVVYTWDGHLRMLHNSIVIMDFHVRRPLAEKLEYYPVVDVCFSAVSLTLLADVDHHNGHRCRMQQHQQQQEAAAAGSLQLRKNQSSESICSTCLGEEEEEEAWSRQDCEEELEQQLQTGLGPRKIASKTTC